MHRRLLASAQRGAASYVTRERALVTAREAPPSGVSPDEAVTAIEDVLRSAGDTCPECPPHAE
jgi:hypothetical protein